MLANFDPSKSSSWDLNMIILPRILCSVGPQKISDTLFSESVDPLLSVLPMCPEYDCSAAAAISCFHAFALCRKGAFDGTITDKIFTPWMHLLQQRAVSNQNSFRIRNSSKVTAITKTNSMKKSEFVITISGDNSDSIKCDAR